MDHRESRGSSPSRRKHKQAVVSFTLNQPPKSMQARDLLGVVPANLVASILARRQKMAALLPKELERRQEENDRAFQLAKDAKEQLLSLQHIEGDASGSKESLLKAQQTYDEHEQFRRRTASRLQTIKNNIQDCQEAIEFWERLSDGNWGHLLDDAARVRAGGASSYAEAKRRTTREANGQ